MDVFVGRLKARVGMVSAKPSLSFNSPDRAKSSFALVDFFSSAVGHPPKHTCVERKSGKSVI